MLHFMFYGFTFNTISQISNISGFNVGGLRLPMIDSNQYDEKFSKLMNNFEIDVMNIK